MALQRTSVSLENGITLATTYERIVGLSISRSKSGGNASVSVNINIGMWTSKARSDAGDRAVDFSPISLRDNEAAPFVATIGNTDILAKAYVAVKAHTPVNDENDYSTATDV